MGLGTGLWKLRHCKTKIPFHAWIILIEMVWNKVVPTWNSLQVWSLYCLKEILTGQWSGVLLTRIGMFVSANKRMWIHQAKSLQFGWDATIKIHGKTTWVYLNDLNFSSILIFLCRNIILVIWVEYEACWKYFSCKLLLKIETLLLLFYHCGCDEVGEQQSLSCFGGYTEVTPS